MNYEMEAWLRHTFTHGIKLTCGVTTRRWPPALRCRRAAAASAISKLESRVRFERTTSNLERLRSTC